MYNVFKGVIAARKPILVNAWNVKEAFSKTKGSANVALMDAFYAHLRPSVINALLSMHLDLDNA